VILQLARFGIVGVAAMVVHWLVVVTIVPFGMPELIANVIGFGVAFNVSYFGHHHWTFASTATAQSTFKRFLLVAITSFIINECMFSLLLRFTALDYRVALAIVLIAVAGLTFVLSKLWAFRH